MIIIPAIHRHSDSDNSDNDDDTGITDEGVGEDVVNNVEEGNPCSDSEFWD